MGLNEPVVPPFPISDYGTGCIGAITALIGLYHRAVRGGSWHGKASLLHYDLLLFKIGLLPESVQDQLRNWAGEDVLSLRHSHSVDQISGTVLRRMRNLFPDFVDNPVYLDYWSSGAYGTDVAAVLPVIEIEGWTSLSLERIDQMVRTMQHGTFSWTMARTFAKMKRKFVGSAGCFGAMNKSWYQLTPIDLSGHLGGGHRRNQQNEFYICFSGSLK